MHHESRQRGLAVIVTACCLVLACGTPRPVATPTLVQITGFGKWNKATSTQTDSFGFSVHAEEVCPPGTGACDRRYPDTAFIDFSIPSLTTFEVSSGTQALTEVGQAVPLGDYQFRKAQLDDGSGASTTWRIAVSVPAMLAGAAGPRKWCGPTMFDIAIVNVSANANPSKSAALPVRLIWGRCASNTFTGWYATMTPGTPSTTSPPTPTGDCPGGAFAKSFDVCESCGSSGLATAKTFWGCDFNDAKAKMGVPGCVYQLRSGPNCP
jgi:hypothetical protein